MSERFGHLVIADGLNRPDNDEYTVSLGQTGHGTRYVCVDSFESTVRRKVSTLPPGHDRYA
jgi:hypothetical protein